MSATLLLALAAAAAAEPGPRERALLIDWATARCIARAAGGQAIGADATASAGALLERSGSGPGVFEKIEAAIGPVLAQRLGDSAPGRYDTLKCLAFARSPALARIVAAARRP